MADLYGSMTNAKGKQVTQMNPREVHLRGWDFGLRVEAKMVNGKEEFFLSITSGSRMSAADIRLGTIRYTDHGPEFEPAP